MRKENCHDCWKIVIINGKRIVTEVGVYIRLCSGSPSNSNLRQRNNIGVELVIKEEK